MGRLSYRRVYGERRRGQRARAFGLWRFRLDQPDQVEYLLGSASPDDDALDRRVGAAAPRLPRLQTTECPPEGAVDQPEAEARLVDRHPARHLIGREIVIEAESERAHV